LPTEGDGPAPFAAAPRAFSTPVAAAAQAEWMLCRPRLVPSPLSVVDVIFIFSVRRVTQQVFFSTNSVLLAAAMMLGLISNQLENGARFQLPTEEFSTTSYFTVGILRCIFCHKKAAPTTPRHARHCRGLSSSPTHTPATTAPPTPPRQRCPGNAAARLPPPSPPSLRRRAGALRLPEAIQLGRG